MLSLAIGQGSERLPTLLSCLEDKEILHSFFLLSPGFRDVSIEFFSNINITIPNTNGTLNVNFYLSCTECGSA